MAYKMGKKSPCRMEDIIAGEQMLDFGPEKGFLKKLKKSIACPGGVCRPDRKTRKAMRQMAKRRSAYSK